MSHVEINMGDKKTHLIVLGILVSYVALRLIAWHTTILLEDHDSVSYLRTITDVVNLDWQRILRWSPDRTPFYPTIGALCKLPGWPVEMGARFASFLFSMLLFPVMLGIGNRLVEKSATLIGLLILCLNPVLVFLSVSVLTEPSYIAIVYLGLFVLLTSYGKLPLSGAAATGLIFGLGFLNRTEGIIFFVGVPILQGILSFQDSRSKDNIVAYIKWCALFMVIFTMLASMQIWHVSQKMGRFAINGRQVWMAILNTADDKSYDEKIYGLSHSPKITNLRYAQKHPEAIKRLVGEDYLKDSLETVKNILRNLLDLYQNQFGILVGPIGLILFGFGLVYLYQLGKRSEIAVIVCFILLNLIAPLAHNVTMRHIAVIAPIMMLLEGMGFMYLFSTVTNSANRHNGFTLFIVLTLAVHLTVGSGISLMKNISNPARYNWEYNPKMIKVFAGKIRESLLKEKEGGPAIAARKSYLAYYASGLQNALPYTSYDKLVKWCRLNKIDFFFLQHRLVAAYPFLNKFKCEVAPPDFLLLYTSKDNWGNNIELYRFIN